jgi:DNA polymerase III delta prime subunit
MLKLLHRDTIYNDIKNILNSFESECKNMSFKKGIYIYGAPGSGKTFFITELLKELDYDIIRYDAGDIRNKSLIDTITCNNISNRNVLYMMQRKVKKIVIVMDEIDGMNNGDKGGITALIKLIRQKKTKKQRTEHVTLNPIICIGNYCVDKKIKELMKVCNTFELKLPTTFQMEQIVHTTIPILNENNNVDLKEKILKYIQGDMRKLSFVQQIFQRKNSKTGELFTVETLENIFKCKTYNDDAKCITRRLLSHPSPIETHNYIMNETDRTIISLLYHENVADNLYSAKNFKKTFPIYLKMMDNICFADYVDRITFQKQIWIFNEMSSMIKIFYNNYIFHSQLPEIKRDEFCGGEIRFTKVLTKYSTEYNNQQFIYHLCQELDMDKRDLITFFRELWVIYGDDFYSNNELLLRAETYFADLNVDITRLDIKRMYRYLDKNVNKEKEVEIDIEIENEMIPDYE